MRWFTCPVVVTCLACSLALAQPPATKPATKPATTKPATKAAPAKPDTAKTAPPKTEAAKPEPAAAAEPDDAAETAIVERFIQVLEKNPRRGTAFDRVYGAYVERGELAKLVERYATRAKAETDDGTAAMILGLIEAQRGRDREAAAAFADADRRLTKNPISSFYLGQSLLVLGKTDDAIPALERAITRQPAPTDLMEVFQTLGRAYQRALKPDEAAAVWTRMEAKFPGDLRVQEQIAQALLEEGQTALALPRLEKLATQTKDKYKQTRYKVQVAELRAKAGEKAKALAEFEALLAQLNPDNWLYRDVRRQIEEIFLRSDDQDGLSKYYAAWVEKNPKDVEAMVRLAKVLDGQARGPESRTWLEKALKLAPTRKDLRRALISSLQDEGKTTEVLAQYAELDKLDPNNPDILREWGRVVLRDTSRNLSPEQKRTEASALWKRLLAARPDDPVVVTQVADLFRNAELTDDALALYRKAVELAPDSAQYREYLGEYLHQLKRPDEALAVWKEIAAGKRGTAKNLARLAEVYAGFGYLEPALATMRAAVTADGKELSLRLQAADLYSKAEKHEDSLAEIVAAGPLATTAEEREQVLVKELRSLASLERLTKSTEELGQALSAAKSPAATDWYRYARFLEADQKPKEALVAIEKSVAVDPKLVPGLATKARLLESTGNLSDAADVNRTLANLDRRYRTEYLTSVSRLEARLGRKEAALQAARDVIASAPGAPEHYESFAQLCFQLGEKDQGLDALRRLVRVNPSEPKHLVTLSQALGEQGQTDEAQQLFWQAFEKTPGLDERLPIVTSLTNAYLQTTQWDKLLERLERLRRDAQDPRDMTICLAQAHQAAGDLSTARSELETLFSPDTRDTQLLQQISTLAENEGDTAGAIRFQQALAKIAPGKETESRLVQLLLKDGQLEEAGEGMEKLVLANDLAGSLTIIDNMLETGRDELASRVLTRLSRGNPDHWELLYREGVALVARAPAEAEAKFRKLLALNLEDEAGAREKSRAKPKTGATATRSRSGNGNQPELTRLQLAGQIAQVIGLGGNEYYGSQNRWSPASYYDARMAGWGWLVKIGRQNSKAELTPDVLHKQLSAGSDVRAAWDRVHLAAVTQDFARIFEVSRLLARRGNTEAMAVCLAALPNRDSTTRRYFAPGFDNQKDTTPALPAEEVRELIGFYRKLRQDPSVSTGVPGASFGGALGPVLQEVRRAKMDEELAQIKAETLAKVNSSEEALEGMGVAVMLEDRDEVVRLIRKYGELLLAEAQSGKKVPGQGNNQFYAMYYPLLVMANYVDADQPDKMFDVLAAVLDMDELARQATAITTPAARANRSLSLVSSSGQQNYVNTFLGKRSNNSWNGAQLAFPAVSGELLSTRVLWALRNTFELSKALDRSPDLFKAIDDRIASTKDASQLTARLARVALLHWSDRKEEAAAALVGLAGQQADSVELKGMLIGLYEETSKFDEALALVEAYQPEDPPQILEKNKAVLRLALRTGQTERAREAAEALFGQRLPAQELLTLSSQMRQLGMSQQADAVATRVQRQAGRQNDTLVTLMQQYVADGKADAAAQIAIQLVRKTKPSGRNSRARTSDDQYRQQALSTLVQLGKLDDLIAKTEKQLEQSPRAVELMDTLAGYYQAAGKTEALAKLEEKILAAKPKDAATRFTMAQRLGNAGKHKEACDLYLEVLKTDPKLMMNDSWEVYQSFRSANRTKDLAAAIEGIDLRQFGTQVYQVTNLIQNMMNSSSGDGVTADSPAFRIFLKAWANLPGQRGELLGAVYREEYWKLPEMYALVREHILPVETETIVGIWEGVANGGGSMSYHGDGRVETTITRLVTMAKSQKQAEAFLADIDKALEKHKNWEGGRALKALLLFGLGRREQAQPIITAIAARDDVPYELGWAIVQETSRATEKNELWIGLTDQLLLKARATYSSSRDGNENEFEYTPGYLLMTHYRKTGRNKESRELLVDAASKPSSNQNDVAYTAYRKVSQATNMGNTLAEVDCGLEGAYFLAHVGEENVLRQYIRQVYGGGDGGEHMLTSMKAANTKVLAAAKRDISAAGLIRVLNAGMGAIKPDQTAQALLMTKLVKGSNPGRIGDLVEVALAGLSTTPETLTGVRKSFDELSAQRPDDLGLAVIRVLVEKKAGDAERLKQEAETLAKRLESLPLEPGDPTGKLTTGQRQTAESQLSVWLAYLAIANQDGAKELAEKLRSRAFDAAARMPSSGVMTQLYHDAGKIALDAGNPAEAEALWNKWLDVVTEPARRKEKKAPKGEKSKAERQKSKVKTLVGSTSSRARGQESGGAVGGWMALVPALVLGADAVVSEKVVDEKVAKEKVGNEKVGNETAESAAVGYLPLTKTQFEQVLEIAQESAKAGLMTLSRKALVRAFEGGAPIPDPAPPLDPNRGISRRGGVVDEGMVVDRIVAEKVGALLKQWAAKEVPAEERYAALRMVVLPKEPADAVRLFAALGGQPAPSTQNVFMALIGGRNSGSPRVESLGVLLGKEAVEAGKKDELLAELTAREKRLESKATGLVIKVAVAVASSDADLGKAALNGLLEQVKSKGASQAQFVDALLAGMQAIEVETLRADAITLLSTSAPRVGPINVVPNEDQSQTPQQLLAQQAMLLVAKFRPKDAAGADTTLQGLRATLQAKSSRYQGEAAPARKALDFRNAASQLVQNDQWQAALELYGEALDLDAISPYTYGNEASIQTRLMVELDSLPAAERYRLLKTWTFPLATRKTLRVMGCLAHAGQERLIAPKRERKEGASGSEGDDLAPTRTCLTTLGLLVDAAKETGQLDELSGETLELMDAKVPGANLLMLLCDLRRGAGAAQRSTLLELPAAIKTFTDRSEGRQSDCELWSHLAVAMATLEEPAVVDAGLQLIPGLIDLSINRGTYPLTAYLRERQAVAQATLRKADGVRPGRHPGLAHWVRGGRVSDDWAGKGLTYPEAFWLGTGDAVGHVSGQGRDHLLFRYPLEGTFEFSADVFMGSWGEANIGYAGIEIDQLNGGLPVLIRPISHSETLQRPDVPDRGNDFNRLTARVTPETITYLTNGQVVWVQKDPARTSPWVMLHTWGTWKSTWKNARIEGSPVIPRTVSLVAGGRLEGWSGRRHNQTLPRDLTRTNPDEIEQDEDQSAPWWNVVNGRLVSMPVEDLDARQRNLARVMGRLSYVRSLQEGETLRYSFRWSDDLAVYPAVGETAFLLKPAGVSLFALPRQQELLLGVTGSERPAAGAAKPVPLVKDKDNVCEVSLAGDTVKVVINGEVVLEQPLAAHGDRTFSFVCFPEEGRADIGEVTLTGNWPESLTAEQMAGPFALREPDAASAFVAKSEIIGDKLLAGDPMEIVWRARQMEPGPRLEYLKAWVLPGSGTAVVRMQGSRTPRDPAGPVAKMAMDAVPRMKGQRLQSGGEIVAPVVEMVRTAKELKQLKELLVVAKALPDTTPLEQRAKRGMLALIAIAQGNTADVLAAIQGMAQTVAASDPKEAEEAKWIEFVVALEAMESAETRYDAFMLLDQMTLTYRVNWDQYNWTRVLMWARTRADWMVRELPLEELGQVRFKQWQATSATRAESRGRGWGQSGWLVRKGEAMHQPGHAEDYLYFMQPLRGDFEVTCDVTSFGYRETKIMYGGKSGMLRYDRKTVEVGALDGWRDDNLPGEIAVGDWYELKLTVSKGVAVWTAAGKEVYREEMGPDADPWMALHSAPINSGGMRNLRITGTPVIPETVEIAIDNRLTKWRPSYYADSMEQNNDSIWRMGDPGEVIAPQQVSNGERETLLRYHRPSFEDGVFAYEFFHTKGAATVAPALDRLAFVLDEAAVKIHWLTDGQYDRTGLAVNNLVEEPGVRVGAGPLPLKLDDWNRVELAITGDNVEVRLNGEAVARRAIEATNQRHLGLFRFMNWGDAKVRGTKYTGQWARTLPALNEQELAGAIPDVVRSGSEPPLQAMTIDFQRAGLDANKAGVEILEAPADGSGLKWTKDGLDIEVPPHKGRKWRTAVVPKVTAMGDFEYTATFSQLRVKTDKPTPGRGVELGVDLLSPAHRAIHTGLFDRLRPGLKTVVTTHVYDPLAGDRKYVGRERDVPEAFVAGRLKVIRQGAVTTTFFAPGKEPTWTAIESVTIGKDDVRQFRFQVGYWDETSVVGARLEKLEIKGEVLLPQK